jgi:hypothetical protein
VSDAASSWPVQFRRVITWNGVDAEFIDNEIDRDGIARHLNGRVELIGLAQSSPRICGNGSRRLGLLNSPFSSVPMRIQLREFSTRSVYEILAPPLQEVCFTNRVSGVSLALLSTTGVRL